MLASGLTGTWRGNRGNGCHTLNRRKSPMLPISPATPPASESSTDSVNSWRKMRLRLEPRARRKATSRERSAARAANRLPRLAQAANSIKPERSINPVRKARVAPPQIVAMKTRPRQRIRLITFFFGIASFQIRIHGVQIGSGLRRSDSRLQMSHHLKHPMDLARVQDLLAG